MGHTCDNTVGSHSWFDIGVSSQQLHDKLLDGMAIYLLAEVLWLWRDVDDTWSCHRTLVREKAWKSIEHQWNCGIPECDYSTTNEHDSDRKVRLERSMEYLGTTNCMHHVPDRTLLLPL